MQDDLVAIKGTQDGLLISLSPTEQWLTVTGELAKRIDEKTAFFSGARVTVELGERPVPKHELTGLKALLERRNLTIVLIMSDSRTTIEAAQALDIRAGSSSPVTQIDDDLKDALPFTSEEEGIPGVLLRRTLRSGRTVHSDGHVIVFGDVNPGAEIVAVGDVFIWGRLRGSVHAGAHGNEDAVICALDMSPTQIRIAGLIATAPDDNKRRQVMPEMAFIRNQQIVVEAWNNK